MSNVRLDRSGDVAEIVLASPPLNLFDRDLIDALIAAVAEVSADPPRALLIRAEGRAVSGGVDVELFHGLSPADASALWTDLLDGQFGRSSSVGLGTTAWFKVPLDLPAD